MIDNSGVTGGCRVPPRDFWPGNFWWPTGKREARKKMENGAEKKENWKREGGKLEGGKVSKGSFFFFFFVHFSKPLKFVLGLLKWEFSTGKKHFTLGKKSAKMTAPSEKYSSCNAPDRQHTEAVYYKLSLPQVTQLISFNPNVVHLFCPNFLQLFELLTPLHTIQGPKQIAVRTRCVPWMKFNFWPLV